MFITLDGLPLRHTAYNLLSKWMILGWWGAHGLGKTPHLVRRPVMRMAMRVLHRGDRPATRARAARCASGQGAMGRARHAVVPWVVVGVGLLMLLGAGRGSAGAPVPIGPLPPVPVPADNPLTPAKVDLGRRLFFDARLSADGSLACVSCHLPDQGWATHTPLSPAYPTHMERRLSPTLINVAYNPVLLWDGRAASLEAQALGPIQNPLHMNQNLDLLIERLNTLPDYAARFQQVFGTPVTPEALGKALAAFERTVITRPAPFDRYLSGDRAAMTASAVRGLALFQGKARCILCHHGPNFTDNQFHNLGVPEVPLLTHPLVQAALRFDAKRMGMPEYAQVTDDLGRYLVTKDAKDKGAFKTPTLRNVAQRDPYMHNGAFHALEEVIAFYDRGGGASAGTSPLLQPLALTAQDQQDLLAFLQALTGDVQAQEPAESSR